MAHPPAIKEQPMDLVPSIQNCLSMNHAYQEMLLEAIEELQVMLQSNRDTQREMIIQLKAKKTVPKPATAGSRWYTRSLVIFQHPYFKDVNGMRAPPNMDEKTKKEMGELDPYIKAPKQWTKKEHQRLKQYVRANLLDMATENRRDSIGRVAIMDKSSASELARKLEEDIKALKNLPTKKLMKTVNRPLDWLRISAVDFQGERDPFSCELTWKNFVCKGSDKWSKQEDNALKALAKKKEGKDWDRIAQKMGAKWTAFQCCQRYHGKLTSRIKNGPFSPDEDKELLLMITLCRTGDDIPWSQVAYHMEGRTRTQLYYRWERALNPLLRRGKWSREEDVMLIAAVQAHGRRWTRVKDFLPGRTANQCRERYVNSFSGNYVFGHWSAEEDAKLIDLVEKYGPGKWALISSEMPWRNDNMVLMRYKRLTRNHNLKQLKSATESVARPQGSEDFAQLRLTSSGRREEIVNQLWSENETDHSISKQKCSLLHNSLVRHQHTASMAEPDYLQEEDEDEDEDTDQMSEEYE
ncbi:snRNA-activating protein complex subunit 4-like isoform X1 [Ornithodoros turicata]|uniref:snRNA-activating protein complex subunit 4-like isoform X1 n=1 Tax=Ornithodoros turicata TaxID=34597 RepID=UPI003138D9E3